MSPPCDGHDRTLLLLLDEDSRRPWGGGICAQFARGGFFQSAVVSITSPRAADLPLRDLGSRRAGLGSGVQNENISYKPV